MQPSASDPSPASGPGARGGSSPGELVLFATLLLVLEILGRRLALWSMVRVPEGSALWGKLDSEARGRDAPRGAGCGTGGPDSRARGARRGETQANARPAPPAAELSQPSMADALARARRAAGKELGR